MKPESTIGIATGLTQGIGFRPYVARLAYSHHISGWVRNEGATAKVFAQGNIDHLCLFKKEITKFVGQCGQIQWEESRVSEQSGFEILPSQKMGPATFLSTPDFATCRSCINELFDPNNRRYRYALIACAHCGPRYSISEGAPFDRKTTSLSSFKQCASCLDEFHSPNDRRFHSELNACPNCGPRLFFSDMSQETRAEGDSALKQCEEFLLQGKIVAVKALGGFHLMAQAENILTIQRLRERKRRPHKPFAVLFPSLQVLGEYAFFSEWEKEALLSEMGPIVLLKQRKPLPEIAPSNASIGALLPCNPIQHLLVHDLGIPLIATSANLSDEPICVSESEIFTKLQRIADAVLYHDRPILNRADDSILRFIQNKRQVIRRARGFSVCLGDLGKKLPDLLAVGGQLKNTVAWSHANQLYLSPHLGSLNSLESQQAFQNCVARTVSENGSRSIACDRHPDFFSSQEASRLGQAHPIQHHEAHIYSVMWDQNLTPPLLAVTWDGFGLGDEGEFWGGEFFHVTREGSHRVRSLRPIVLPGGEKGFKEPRRIALSLLREIQGVNETRLKRLGFGSNADNLLKICANQNLSPLTSSVGRLFDGIASLLGLVQENTYEGQAAITLESVAREGKSEEPYPWEGKGFAFDWEPMVREILDDFEDSIPLPEIARRFHETLADIIVSAAKSIGEKQVVLSGGCFQNVLLLERTMALLKKNDFIPYVPDRIPLNDGGLSVGQLWRVVCA